MARTSRKQQAWMPGCDSSEPLNVPRGDTSTIENELCIGKIEIGLYVRLSCEDNGKKEMDSVGNQLGLLQSFSQKLVNARIAGTYVDNGFSGTDFDRPMWEQMLADAKKGKINCIIVKDLSRFARNYLEAGDYLQKIFPFLGIRFIAVNDCYDSSHELFPEKDLIAEFKNLANDYYSKDISRKIMSAFQAKKGKGEFIGSKAPYGYKLADNHFVVDGPAADVVRRIFAMKMQGVSSYEIAKVLNGENIPSPSQYAKENGAKKYRGSKQILWQQQAVNRILYNRAYAGDLVQGKYNCSKYSNEKNGKKEEGRWEITENAHEPLVSRELFEAIQEIHESNRAVWREKQGNEAYENVLRGILVCGTCHHAIRRNKDVRNGKVRYYYYCASPYNYSQSGCTTSSIVDHKVLDVVLQQIRIQVDLAVDTGKVLDKITKSCGFQAKRKEMKERLEQTRQKLGRCTYLKTSIYEDMKQGILTKEEFMAAKERYSLQTAELESVLRQQEEEWEEFEHCASSEHRWLKTFMKFRNAKELTREMAAMLLERVELFGDKRIHITFRFRNEYEYFLNSAEWHRGIPGGGLMSVRENYREG